MVRCLIAHYCAIARTILIFRFLTICLAHVGPAVRGFDPLFDPFCIWGNELSMKINQVEKLRKIVRIKKLETKNNKIFVCTMKKTSVHYRMVLTIIPCLFLFLCPISNIEKIFMHILVFRPFQSSSLMITSQTTSMVRRRGRFSYNTHGSILKCS